MIVMTCGHRSAGTELVQARLRDAGLADVEGVPPDPLDPADFVRAEAWMAGLRSGQGWCAAHRPGSAKAWLQAYPSLLLVLVYSPPAWVLSMEGAGEDVAALLDEWVQCNGELLKLAARHPDRCLLFNSLTAVHAASALVSQVAKATGLPLAPGETGLDRSGFPALESSLARLGIPERNQAQALYLELESAATLDSEVLRLNELESTAAFAEARQLRQALAIQMESARSAEVVRQACDAELASLRLRLTALEDAMAEAIEQADKAKASIATLSVARDEAQRAHLACTEENELLRLQMLQVREELEASTLKAESDRVSRDAAAMHERANALSQVQAILDQATKDREALSAKLEDLNLAHEHLARELAEERSLRSAARVEIDNRAQEVATLQLQLAGQTRELAAASAEKARVAAALDQTAPAAEFYEVKQQAELLQLQLDQAQEELEHYHLANLRLDDALARHIAASERRSRLWQANQPADVVLDLREAVSASNWHEPEPHGRWTGPGNVSRVLIPALRPGTYCIQLHVISAIAPDVLQGLRVALNDRELAVDVHSAELPCILIGSTVVDAADGQDWALALSVPRTVSPRELGIEDDRPLGVCVGSIVFTLLDRAGHNANQ